jgi:hypothetical protein
MSEDFIFPPKFLTVIIADYAKFTHAQEPVEHGSVKIELTQEQLNKLRLNYTDSRGTDKHYEKISQCFLEE